MHDRCPPLPMHLKKWAGPTYKAIKTVVDRPKSLDPYNVIPSTQIIASVGPMWIPYEEEVASKAGYKMTPAFLLDTVTNAAHPVSHIYVVAHDTLNYAFREKQQCHEQHAPYTLQITQQPGNHVVNANKVDFKDSGFADASLKITHTETKRSSDCKVTMFNPQWLTILGDSKSSQQRLLQQKILNAYDETNRSNSYILIHCQEGINRTAQLVFILLFMKHLADHPEDARLLQAELEKSDTADISRAIAPAISVYRQMKTARDFRLSFQELLICMDHAVNLNQLRLQKTFLKEEAQASKLGVFKTAAVSPPATSFTKSLLSYGNN